MRTKEEILSKITNHQQIKRMITTTLIQKQLHELELISIINRDGLSLKKINLSDMRDFNKFYKDSHLFLKELSKSNGTYIAFGFRVFIVKIKQ